MGIGDASRGALIPLREAVDEPSYAQYQGQAVRSRMQQSLLLEMAQLTGGTYVPAGTRDIKLDRLYQDKIASKPRRDIEVAKRKDLVHRYHWFVLAALVLLTMDMLVGERNISSEGGVG